MNEKWKYLIGKFCLATSSYKQKQKKNGKKSEVKCQWWAGKLLINYLFFKWMSFDYWFENIVANVYKHAQMLGIYFDHHQY